MLYTVYAEGGTVYSDYLCSTCVDIASELRSGTEFIYGDFREEALKRSKQYEEADEVCFYGLKVIGNIYENPELKEK
ncbi:MAG: hypothetical protein PUK21_01445 [Peptostreptococcaceae bacterium]|nr:hypothetical protein [Peptostreptococcaceae bacterium]MDY5738673.1 hypothetical protein [Anaerovoracaceae bacterium]